MAPYKRVWKSAKVTKQILIPETTKPLLPVPLVIQVLLALLSEASLGPQSRKPLAPE